MGRKDKDSDFDDYKKLKDEIIYDKVSEFFRNHPKDYIAKMEEVGFESELWRAADALRSNMDAAEVEEDGEPFEDKMVRLTTFFRVYPEPSDFSPPVVANLPAQIMQEPIKNAQLKVIGSGLYNLLI